ncbi:hypothetical protein L3Q82_009581, partial [Scortum barcoo]
MEMQPCHMPVHLEDQTPCRKRRRTDLSQEEPAGDCKQVQDFIPRPSSPAPDPPQVPDLTLTPEPSIVQVQEVIPKHEELTSSPDLHQAQCHMPVHLEDQTPCRKRRKTYLSQEKPAGDCKQVQDFIPRPQSSSPAPDPPQVPDLTQTPEPSIVQVIPKPEESTSSPDLPQTQVQEVTPAPQASSSGLRSVGVPQSEAPLMIHGYSVEEYQKIYHSVVDEMLRYKNGRSRPYSLQLGRKIKQRLWEKLNRLIITESYGEGVYPPLIDVDISGEPEPKYLSTSPGPVFACSLCHHLQPRTSQPLHQCLLFLPPPATKPQHHTLTHSLIFQLVPYHSAKIHTSILDQPTPATASACNLKKKDKNSPTCQLPASTDLTTTTTSKECLSTSPGPVVSISIRQHLQPDTSQPLRQQPPAPSTSGRRPQDQTTTANHSPQLASLNVHQQQVLV